ncbi:hypothetical protein AUP68_12997 [Ilyonectria robusta]
MEKRSLKGKKPAPRRMTDSRREQNRIASRNYREKRRQKLELLDQFLGPGPGLESSSHNTSVDKNDHESEPVISQSVINHIDPAVDVDLGIDEYVVPGHNTSFQPTPFITDNWSSLSVTTRFTSAAVFNDTSGPLTMNSNPSQALLRSQSNPTQTIPDPPLSPQVDESIDNDESLRQVLQGVNNLSVNQKRVLIQLLQQQTQDATTTSSPSPYFAPYPQYPFNNNNSAFSLSNNTPLSTRLQTEALKFSLALSLTATAGPCQSPSQYAMSAGLFSALFANCYALGMCDVQPLLTDEGWSVFGLGPELGYHPSQLSVVRAKFRNLAPDLQPCDLQLTFAHHPYIDVLPFKSLRKNIIKALDHEQPTIDEDELCHDLLSGLVCWGSQQSTIGMGAAVPWDVRCWEPSVWFLHKYRNFVGGWDDEMWKGARWWHNMRGERIQASPQTAPLS